MNRWSVSRTALSTLVVIAASAALTSCNYKKESETLYRGPSPSLKRLKELKEMGIKTIVSVRNNPTPRKAEYAKKIGLKFLTVKTSVLHSPTVEDVRRFITIVNDPANQPVYVCCVGGRDRTLFYVTAYKIAVEGADAQKSVAVMDDGRWHRWWPGFRHYVEILLDGAEDKYGWKPSPVVNNHQ